MDSITQALLGAAIGEATLGRKIGSKGAVIGAIIASIPDLDVVLLPLYSAAERISVHRGFSHSIVFSFVGAFIISFILSKIKWTKLVAYSRLWLFTWLALFTHMLLDAFTSYGTQLFLPFSNYRVSFNAINIVDPVYTIPLLIGLVLSLTIYRNKKTRIKPTLTGLAISTFYLILTLGIKGSANNSFEANLKETGIVYNELLTVPVGIGSVNWYGVAKTQESLFIGKYNTIAQNQITFSEFPINDYLLENINPELTTTLKWFSNGFYTVAEHDGKIRLYNMQCDMQGIRTYGDYKAPTAFYFEITPFLDESYNLSTGMHKRD
ncbi:metal-dependent hydrolase [Algibacter luteus]|uniref:metal-dependent hydrolase n=1 Tax=Algibacter luteus TaxID=1178825 RepID=UPI0025964AE7|nr:metal-dependent hydrolase [Algibacter luteus]WJJ96416.1 metal-dependent hydrolase [Algibacter luteus]